MVTHLSYPTEYRVDLHYPNFLNDGYAPADYLPIVQYRNKPFYLKKKNCQLSVEVIHGFF